MEEGSFPTVGYEFLAENHCCYFTFSSVFLGAFIALDIHIVSFVSYPTPTPQQNVLQATSSSPLFSFSQYRVS